MVKVLCSYQFVKDFAKSSSCGDGAGRADQATRRGSAVLFFRPWRGADLPPGRYNGAIGMTFTHECDATARSAAFPQGAERGTMLQLVKGLSMEKWLCWGSMGVAGLLLLLFLLDVSVGIPFGGISKFVDIVSILCSGLVLYLAWDAFKDLR
jgi:hypothetical protein